MITLNLDDINFHSAEIKDLIKILPPINLDYGPWICGGTARKLFIGAKFTSDIDLFFASETQFQEYLKLINIQFCDNIKEVHETDFALTLTIKDENVTKLKSWSHWEDSQIVVQLIKRQYYKNLHEIFNDFDYSVCKIATDGVKVVMTESALEDLGNKVLRLEDTNNIRNGLKRVINYTARGYTPVPGLLKTIIEKTDEMPDWVDYGY